MINKVKTIIRAKLYSKYAMKNEEWYKDRLEACRKCELNSINKKEKSIREKLLFFLNFLNPFCTVCGCEI